MLDLCDSTHRWQDSGCKDTQILYCFYIVHETDVIPVIISIPVPMGTQALILLSLPVDVNHSSKCLALWPEHKLKLPGGKESLSVSPESSRNKYLGVLHPGSSLTVNWTDCVPYLYLLPLYSFSLSLFISV